MRLFSHFESSDCQSMSRESYRKVSNLDRDRLINCFENNRDWITLAEELGIKRQTARSIILVYQKSGWRTKLPKGGNRSKSISDEQLQKVTDYIAEKPTINLAEMVSKLRVDFPEWQPCSVQTMSRVLDGQLITLKISRTVTDQWNTQRTKELRQSYAQWMMSEGLQKNLIYCDEFGSNIWTARTQAWSQKGERAVRVVQGQRGQNLTTSIAISPEWGLVHWKFIRGGMTKSKFSDFVSKASELIDSSFILIYDNATSHIGAPHMKEGQDHKLLPPYSPFLNPTERAISCVKAAVKRLITQPDVQLHLSDRNAAQQANISLQEHRLLILQEILSESFMEITQFKCRQ